ncbi:MAG: hypothetical protein HY011_18955 [Acidobacteria bacterium]|nr:hypothetical protein [Acidobacteriota bacterium]
MAENSKITIKEIEQRRKLVALPIDFDALIAEGLLEKKGAWYKVTDISKLPQHVRAKMGALRTEPQGTFVRFRRARKN